MNQYQIEKTFMLHEGGTKYYQVILMYNTEKNCGVVVNHYGAYTQGASITPKHHGQTEMASGSIATVKRLAKEKALSKLKRGYRVENDSEGGLSTLEFRDYLRNNYKTNAPNAKSFSLDEIFSRLAFNELNNDGLHPQSFPSKRTFGQPVEDSETKNLNPQTWGSW